MRPFVALLVGSISTAALSATSPVGAQPKLDAAWQARTRAMLKELIEIPTVAGRGQMPAAAEAIGRQLREGDFPAADMRILPYEGLPGDETAAFLFRWRAPHPTKKPMLIIGHMDVVEASARTGRMTRSNSGSRTAISTVGGRPI